jgi:hypothetical protein
MERDMQEILQSQFTMLQRLGKSPATAEKAADIAKVYRQQERHAKSWCATAGIHAVCVSFHSLVHRPDEVLPQVATFLGTTDRLRAMRACVDPALHRAHKIVTDPITRCHCKPAEANRSCAEDEQSTGTK